MIRIPRNIQSELFGKCSEWNNTNMPLPDRGLMIRDPYITDILLSKKVWELRGTPTKVRGRIGLIKSKSGHLFGEANLVDVIGPLSYIELISSWQIGPHDQKELIESEQAPYRDRKGSTRTFAWVLSNVISYQPPIPYRHPLGAITFVDLKKALAL